MMRAISCKFEIWVFPFEGESQHALDLHEPDEDALDGHQLFERYLAIPVKIRDGRNNMPHCDLERKALAFNSTASDR